MFDEIDAGIGGVTAHRVAETLSRLAARAQVVTITHLPQIANVATRHFRVEKVPLCYMTDFAWDGTDEFGDKLANGVYLYRVQARINGVNYDKFDTGTDGFFEGGYGKIVILR